MTVETLNNNPQPHNDGVDNDYALSNGPQADTTTTTTTTSQQIDNDDDNLNYYQQQGANNQAANGQAATAQATMLSGLSQDQNVYVTRLKRIIQLTYDVIELVVTMIFTIKDWDQECDRGTQFDVFLISRMSFNAIFILIHLLYFSKPIKGFPSGIKKLTTFCHYAFVIFGYSEIGKAEDCPGSKWVLTLVLCILSTVILFAPLILVLLICCCLPCIVRALAAWIDMQNAPETASVDELNELHQTYTNKWSVQLATHQQRIATAQAANSGAHHIPQLSDECPICLVDYEDNDEVTVLPCYHTGHKACLDTWLKINKTCAVCRDNPFDKMHGQNMTDSVDADDPNHVVIEMNNTNNSNIANNDSDNVNNKKQTSSVSD